jgi:hypothetical protein
MRQLLPWFVSSQTTVVNESGKRSGSEGISEGIRVRDCSGKLPAAAGTWNVKPDPRTGNGTSKHGIEDPRGTPKWERETEGERVFDFTYSMVCVFIKHGL